MEPISIASSLSKDDRVIAKDMLLRKLSMSCSLRERLELGLANPNGYVVLVHDTKENSFFMNNYYLLKLFTHLPLQAC